MDTMAPIRQTLHRRRSISLAAAPAAAAAVRREVADLIDSWDVAVDPSVAALLASELVTNAIKHAAGQTVGMRYVGYFVKGEVFDSNAAPKPVFTFTLGSG